MDKLSNLESLSLPEREYLSERQLIETKSRAEIAALVGVQEGELLSPNELKDAYGTDETRRFALLRRIHHYEKKLSPWSRFWSRRTTIEEREAELLKERVEVDDLKRRLDVLKRQLEPLRPRYGQK